MWAVYCYPGLFATIDVPGVELLPSGQSEFYRTVGVNEAAFG
jgi:hypothetical protein